MCASITVVGTVDGMKNVALLVTLALAVGCEEAKQAHTRARDEGDGRGGLRDDVATARADARRRPPAAPTTFFPAKLAENEGIVFAETKGGSVEVQAVEGVATAEIPDGTLLKMRSSASSTSALRRA